MQNIAIELADVFKALGDPTRLKLVRLLASHSERKLCVGALANKLGITQPAASQHLKVLKHAGLVEPNRDGFRVHYAIKKSALAAFKTDVEELCRLAFDESACEESCQKPTKS